VKKLLGVAPLLLAPCLWAASYTYTSNTYTTVVNYTSCTAGTCETFTTSMKLTGTFATVPSSLPPNVTLLNIAAIVTSFSFNNGITAFASTVPNTRVSAFQVSTDSQGQITQALIDIQLWMTGTSPHVAGNRLDEFVIVENDNAYGNSICGSVGISPDGTPDTCLTPGPDSASSFAHDNSNGSWVTNLSPTVPTLSQWSQILLAALLGVAGWIMMRRRLA
jgi:hypothetical protein